MTQPTVRAEGIDISHWQLKVDWGQVKAAGMQYVFIKATQGAGAQDANFKANWADTKAAGMPRGAYHFYSPHIDPQEQAEKFVRALGPDTGDLPPVFDLEDHGGVSNVNLIQGSEIWLTTVEKLTGRKPIIYTRMFFWKDQMWDKIGHYPDWTKDYDFWVAHYINAQQPAVHPSWPSWKFWQYTESGRLVGLTTKVDRNYFNGTVADFQAWLKGKSPNAPTASATTSATTPAPTTVTTPAPTTTPAPAKAPVGGATYPNAKVTNQFMINLFRTTFGGNYWPIVQKAGIENIAAQRNQRYSGPKLEALTALSDDERARLLTGFKAAGG